MKRDPEMFYAWQRRRKPLPTRNRKRLAKRRAEQFGVQAAYVRERPCMSCGAPPPVDPHHVRSRGAGGTDADCVGLCRPCHTEVHTVGITGFARKHGLDLRRLAAALHARLKEQR